MFFSLNVIINMIVNVNKICVINLWSDLKQAGYPIRLHLRQT